MGHLQGKVSGIDLTLALNTDMEPCPAQPD